MTSERTRNPAVAGLFYPSDPVELRRHVRELIAEASKVRWPHRAPKALILPHAGYLYSGLIAARGYALLRGIEDRIHHVLLLGPSHFIPVEGMVVCSFDVLKTPLGEVRVGARMRERALESAEVSISDVPHENEHSLEVHLPFLQEVLGSFDVLPVAVGKVEPADCGEMIELLWGDDTLVVVSSDLSHFSSADSARRIDSETSRAIESLDCSRIERQGACGSDAVRGLLWFARRHSLTANAIEVGTSAAVTKDESRVVGYGSYALS